MLSFPLPVCLGGSLGLQVCLTLSTVKITDYSVLYDMFLIFFKLLHDFVSGLSPVSLDLHHLVLFTNKLLMLSQSSCVYT